MSLKRLAAGLAMACSALPAIGLADTQADLAELRKQIEAMKGHYEQRIHALEERLEAAERAAQDSQQRATPVRAAHEHSPRPATQSPLDQALAELEPAAEDTRAAPSPERRDLFSHRIGDAEVRLIDVSLVTDFAAGWSSADNDLIEELQGGEHDPKRRGFTLQQAELGLHGAVDPYFTATGFILFSEEGVELEEAFFTTTSLPYNLQLEGGFFLTEFGRNNPRHLDEWDWVDQPVINTRLFGGDGSRAAGFRLGWLLPTPWFSEFHFGAQDPTSDTMVSFLGEGHGHGEEEGHGHEEEEEEGHGHAEEFEEGLGGFASVKDDIDSPSDLVYLLRWVNGADLSPELNGQLGLSALFGPNATGDDGDTIIYGADLVFKWRPVQNFRGWPFLTWESEIMRRDFDIDRSNPAFEDEDTLRDWGLYTQLLYGFKHPWSAGLRFEFAGGSNDGPEARDEDPLRSDRYRISPLLVWQPTEFSRIRLQYNYDKADFLDADGRCASRRQSPLPPRPPQWLQRGRVDPGQADRAASRTKGSLQGSI